MAAENKSKSDERLERLTPEARSRVEQVLKAAIEAEVAGEATLEASSRAKEFSRGIIFSRSRGRVASQFEENTIVNEALQMDEATFSKFAERLSALKSIKDRSEG